MEPMTALDREKMIAHQCGRVALAAKGEIGRRARPMGLSGPEALLLAIVSIHGSSTLAELARLLKHAHPSVLRHIDVLERRGYIERTPHPTDRRVKVVSLTSEGEKVAPEIREIIRKVNKLATKGLDAATVELLLRLLQRVAANLGVEQEGSHAAQD